MRGIAKMNFGCRHADPSVAKPACQITTERRRDHRHHDEVEAGADFEARGRNPGIIPWRHDGKSDACTERQQQQCQGA
jgi:hypothetical protein